MAFIRKVVNSDKLADIIDIPESLRNRKVEILIFPYENTNMESLTPKHPTRARGLLERYKNEELKEQETGAWAKAVVDKHENS
ncbi:MAG: hypothetical protein ACOX2E_08700 [Syntrophaceticus sp.]